MDLPQQFWDTYRPIWRRHIARWRDGMSTPFWTRLITDAATEACEAMAEHLGVPLEVDHEGPLRIDVFAENPRNRKRVIAFESELAYWGYNGSSGKDWREEFPKLCRIPSQLRVLSSTFKPGTGTGFDAFLREKLDSMRASFDAAIPSEWCLIFGPEDTRQDPDEPWRAYAMNADFSIRRLRSARPLLPRWIIEGRESATAE
jgi:hypothetical protein